MLKLFLIASGCALNGPIGLSPTATPMRNTLCLSFTGKYRKYLPSFSAASGAHIFSGAHGPPAGVERQHLVVLHRVLVAEVVAGDARVEVVRGIDVELAVENVRRRI